MANFIERIITAFPYTFGVTRTDKGIGSGNASFARPYAPLASGMYGKRYNVERSFNTVGNASLILGQSLPSVDLKANGVYFAGDFSLSRLNEPQAGNI